MVTIEQRVADLETRVESAFAIDAKLKALDTEVSGLKRSGVAEWLRALGPFASSLAILLVGYWINDSVKAAIEREQLDLEYVKQMRDLIKDFDASTSSPTAGANANAIALAMYGVHAIIPLVERLEGGDVANLAAEKGLLLVGANDAVAACPKFLAIVTDKARRFPWQTHKTIIKVIGQSECRASIPELTSYKAQLTQLGTDTSALAKFAHRYSQPAGFDGESAASLTTELNTALDILNSRANL